MSLLSENSRKFISEHVGAFLIAGIALATPLVGGYAHLVSEYKSLSEERVSFEKERATSQVELARAQLDIEKLQAQLAMATDSSRQMLQDVASRQQETTTERARLAEAWKNIEAWRQKLNPEAEYKSLVEQFTALGVDLDHCAERADVEKHQRARILVQRIWYAAAQTNNQANIQFARRIQPSSTGVFECRRPNAP